MIKVKNINGTSKEKYAKSYPAKYKSWLDYWDDKSGCHRPYYCANDNCLNKVEVGAHVIKESSEKDRSWYIIPLCKECNNPSNKEYFEVNEDYLVSVSDKDTSDYPCIPKTGD